MTLQPASAHPHTPHYLQVRGKKTPHYEYRTIVVPVSASKTEAHAYLSLEAETGKWELDRTVIYQGGLTKYWLKRKVFSVH